MEGFLRYEFGGLIFGGAYTWRGLFSEFYRICSLGSIFSVKVRESRKCVNYVIRTIKVEYYPTLSNSCASESTVPKNVFLDFDTLALVLNRHSDQDSR